MQRWFWNNAVRETLRLRRLDDVNNALVRLESLLIYFSVEADDSCAIRPSKRGVSLIYGRIQGSAI